MRSLQFQTALEEFVEQAALRLQAHVEAGEEVPFELDSHSARRGSSPLYCYRPLTGAFISERLFTLRALPSYAKTEMLLEGYDALDRYLATVGHEKSSARGQSRADAALLALLSDVFEEQTDFKLHPERLERALDRLDGPALATAGEVTLVATLHGLTISSPELQLTRGLLIAHPDAIQDAPEQALPRASARAEDDHMLVLYTARDLDPHDALAQGVSVVRELLRALRLFGDGRIALGARAFARVGESSWNTIALGHGGRPHGMLLVTADQEDELRAFCNLVSRRAPHASPVAWALRRFELGCERPSEYEALSDYLLAVRALLDAPSELEPDGAPDGLLAGRLAALCATPEQRATLAERTLAAMVLEREVIAGVAAEHSSGLALVRDISNHLRALLRDIVCGHLPAELALLADELLLSGEEVVGEDTQPSEVLHVAV
ncbi:MAG TPA: hypothetical protein VGI26_03320 [Solirubrobacteraceae bacterium]